MKAECRLPRIRDTLFASRRSTADCMAVYSFILVEVIPTEAKPRVTRKYLLYLLVYDRAWRFINVKDHPPRIPVGIIGCNARNVRSFGF